MISLLLLLGVASVSFSQQSYPEYEEMKSSLSTLHHAVFDLPYDYEYIKVTLMGEIEQKRKEIAPHFPDRSQTGSDADLIDEAFRSWYALYPDEAMAYIDYLRSFIRNHKSSQ